MSELNAVIDKRITAVEVASASAVAAERNLIIDSNEPIAPSLGQLWSDISNPGTISLKCFNGTNWIQVNS